jgi:hypothetical protein
VCIPPFSLYPHSADASSQLQRAKSQLDAAGRTLMGALLFSCGGRGPHAFGGVPMMDATAFQKVLLFPPNFCARSPLLALVSRLLLSFSALIFSAFFSPSISLSNFPRRRR